MKLHKINPKFTSEGNPRIGLITLGSDFRIEKDFNNVIYGKNIDLFINRIHCYNPLTNETLAKMANDITDVTKEILPNEKLDCVAYGCTSGTVAAGYDIVKKKYQFSKTRSQGDDTNNICSKSIKKIRHQKYISIYTLHETNKSINCRLF